MSQSRERSVTIKTEPGTQPAAPLRYSAARSQPSRSSKPAIKVDTGTKNGRRAASTSEPPAKRSRTSSSTTSTSTASVDRRMPPPSQSYSRTSSSHRPATSRRSYRSSPRSSARPTPSIPSTSSTMRSSSGPSSLSVQPSSSMPSSSSARPTSSLPSSSTFRWPQPSSTGSSMRSTPLIPSSTSTWSLMSSTSSTRSIRFRLRQANTDAFLDIPLNTSLHATDLFEAAYVFYQATGSSYRTDMPLRCKIPGTHEIRWIVNDEVVFMLLCDDLKRRPVPMNGDLIVEVTPGSS